MMGAWIHFSSASIRSDLHVVALGNDVAINRQQQAEHVLGNRGVVDAGAKCHGIGL